MKSQILFQEKKEIKRLAVQNRLLSGYERPIFKKLFSGQSDITVLDIGCNDGKKTTERFKSTAVSKVIGLEYNQELTENANEKYGSEKFLFYQCDAEEVGFKEKLSNIMNETGIKGFDVIYLSFVLMHLSAPGVLLDNLYTFLNPGGKLVVVEANDSESVLTPDDDGLLGEFLDILKKDVYSGNREVGRNLKDMLQKSDYSDITVWNSEIKADGDEIKKKKDIFKTFFSYLPEDVAILCEKNPDKEEYRVWSQWLKENYKKLKKSVIQEESCISMGMQIISCMKGSK